MSEKPRLAITVGDPAGIGPEVAAKALNDPEVRQLADFVVFGDRRLWQRADGGGLAKFEFRTVPVAEFAGAAPGVTLVEFPEVDYAAIPRGSMSAAGGAASIGYILAAIDAVKAGRLDGVVTGPINKEAIQAAGYSWPGHTELFAEKFACDDMAMMFAGGPIRVVLATIHMSLADVLRALSTEQILRIVRLADRTLKDYFAIAVPRIGVCGLNPHAGEGGRFGHEEHTVIIPALDQAREEGICVFGPLPADTIYRAAMQGKYDIVVAMYHDQGLIPIKTVAFEQSVNITIGIPAIRTSVDHGTAFDIAGRGEADPSSMASAIRMAVRMHEARKAARGKKM
ncbi:MAG: 4-hydroxythreonine-4-phosphate dehydrogenase PdxA [Planctomycetes bacterium]|nr:4-hydroxythreonine-4-phosphate dehydrogenase PdxA [Planctomycetota bacterium]